MTWRQKILRSREVAETKSGKTPAYVVLNEVVYQEFIEEEYVEVFDIGGMIVLTGPIQNPFEFLINLDGEAEDF